MKKETGFTLVEILVSLAIMVIAVVSTLQLENYLLQLKETNDIMIVAMNAIQGVMNEIKNVPFDNIAADYDNQTFTLNELDNRKINNIGVVEVTTLEAGYLLKIKIVVCFSQKNRIIGEDLNLNGVLNAGEDKNANGELDSPCSFETAIVYK